VYWESFGWRKDSIRHTIFRASPDGGSDKTSMDTQNLLGASILDCCFNSMMELSIVIISVNGMSVHVGQGALRSHDQHIPCSLAEIDSICALNIERRNTRTITSPKPLTGHIPLGAPSSKTPKDQTLPSNSAACVKNTILNKAREKGRLLAPGIPVTTVLFTTDIIRNKLRESLKLLSLRPGLYILMQKAVMLSKCRIVRTMVAEQ